VLTDREHKSGFKFQAQILSQMCSVVESGGIKVPLFQPYQVSDPNMTNQQFIRNYLSQLLLGAFPNLQAAQVQIFLQGLFGLRADMNVFKQHLRDFLVQLKEFSGDSAGNEELYLEERELEAELKKRAELESRKIVPGLLKPAERDDMED
jgi:exportin-1